MATKKRKRVLLAKPAKIGRPRIELDVEVLKALASIGATEVEICAGLIATGIQLDLRTLKRRLQEPAYRELWDVGKATFQLGLRRLQWRHAKMPNSAGVTMTIHMSKHQLGETEKSLLEISGKDGGAIETKDVSARSVVTSRIAGIASRKATTEGAG
jgi:hypothetical protein